MVVDESEAPTINRSTETPSQFSEDDQVEMQAHGPNCKELEILKIWNAGHFRL